MTTATEKHNMQMMIDTAVYKQTQELNDKVNTLTEFCLYLLKVLGSANEDEMCKQRDVMLTYTDRIKGNERFEQLYRELLKIEAMKFLIVVGGKGGEDDGA